YVTGNEGRLSTLPGSRIGDAPGPGTGPSRLVAQLVRPGLLQALDQGNHAVVPRGGDPGPPALGGDAAVEDVDLGRPPRQHVLQHAGLVVVRLRNGLVHRLARRAHRPDPGPLADL